MTWKSHIDLIYVVNIRDYNVTHHKKNYKTVCHRFNVLSVVSYLHAPCKMNIIFFVLYDIYIIQTLDLYTFAYVE